MKARTLAPECRSEADEGEAASPRVSEAESMKTLESPDWCRDELVVSIDESQASKTDLFFE